MILRNVETAEIETFAQLSNSKNSFKDTLLSWLEKGITKIQWCFALEDEGLIVGRIIYGVYDQDLEILNLRMTNSNQHVLDRLLKGSLVEMKKLNEFDRVGCHLYSTHPNFDSYLHSLINSGFKVTQEKKSFIWKDGGIPNYTDRLKYISLKDVNVAEYIEAIEKVTQDTLDQDDLDCVMEFGDHEAAIKYFNQLKEIDYNENWWKLAYNYNNELVGLVIPQKFNNEVGAINYIGVVPEERGNGYVNDLLIHGVKVLTDNNIIKVIADIDVNNFPLEKALIKENFQLDSRMQVLKLDF